MQIILAVFTGHLATHEEIYHGILSKRDVSKAARFYLFLFNVIQLILDMQLLFHIFSNVVWPG